MVRRWGQDGEQAAQDAKDNPRDAAQDRQEAILKDIPSIFTILHKPVLAWEREAR